MIKRIAIVLVALIFVGILSLELMYQMNTSGDTESLRAGSDMQFAELSVATTAYQLYGEKEDPLLVLIHGFSIPHLVFDQMIDHLRQSGHQVLVYDVVGRGLSDKPDVAYNKDLYIDQLHQLLTALGLKDAPKALVGYSMGGAISVAYTMKYPELVTASIHLAPGGMYISESPAVLSALPPFGQDRLMFSMLDSYFSKIQFPTQEQSDATVQQSKMSGFCGALTSTMRELSGGFQVPYQQVGQMEKPTLFLWGTADPIVSYELSKEVLQSYPNSKLILFENADHYIPFSHAKEISVGIAAFLNDRKVFAP